MISRLKYYLAHLPGAVRTIENRAQMLALLFGLPVVKPVLLRLADGTQFKVRTAMDVWIVIETYIGHTYEQDVFEIESDWLIIDIGAGLGEFCITAAKKCSKGIVYAYEPFRESYDLMQENILLNKVANVVGYPYGVGGHVGPLRLNKASGNPVWYSTVMNDNVVGENDTIVQGTTLDEIFEASHIQKCDLLKIDCEGGEYDILFHASPLTLQKIERVCLEYHNGMTKFDHRDLVRFLECNGFSVVLKPSPVHGHTGLLFAVRNCDNSRPTLRPSRTA